MEERDRSTLERLRVEMTHDISEMVKEKVTHLTTIWSDVGINYEATRNRLDRTRAHLSNLLDKMLDGEQDMKCTLLRNIEQFKIEVQQLSVELAVASPQVPDSLTLIEKENIIRERLEQLKEMRNSRKRERKRLRAKESELCAKLGVRPSILCSVSIPSEKDLHDLENHISAMEKEKIVRSCTLALLREDIIAKLNLLDAQPEGQLEIQLIDDPNGFVLSEGNLNEMKSFLERLKHLEEARRLELAGLLDQLTLFFDRLDIPLEDQDHIRSSSTGLTLSTLAALRSKLGEYELQKKARLQEFVTRVKDELLTWYKKCCVPESRVYLDDSQDVTEERLALLEEQLKALKDFYYQNKVIISKAERYEVLWSRSLELDKLATDPSRLTNRGGRLLLETNERKRLQVEIPRLRQEIEKFISTYSGSNKEFAVWGKNFLEHLDSRKQAYAQEKERERLERESRRRAHPLASSSSKRAYCGSPSSSASKVRRLGTSSEASASSRRGGTPGGKSNLAAGTAIPVRAGSAAVAAARGFLRRSLKAQQRKKGAHDPQRFNDQGAEEGSPSTSTAKPLRAVTTMDSFARFLAQRNEQLTSSILPEKAQRLRPEAADEAVYLDVTLPDEQAPSS